MRLIQLVLSAFSALASSNSFVSPVGNTTITEGSELHIQWTNISGSTVTIILKKGGMQNLQTVTTIGDHLSNNGTVDWPLPTDLNGRYALEILNDDNEDDVNYSDFFTVDQLRNSTTVSNSAPSSTIDPNSTFKKINSSVVITKNTSGLLSTALYNTSKTPIPTSGNLSTTGLPLWQSPSESLPISDETVGGPSGISSTSVAASRASSSHSGADSGVSANYANKVASMSLASSICVLLFTLL